MRHEPFVPLHDALRILREHAITLLDTGEHIDRDDVLRAYDDARDALEETAFTIDEPHDTRRIWVDTDAIVVAIRERHSDDHWWMYGCKADTAQGRGRMRLDEDPGDISVADARRIVGLGGYV